MTKNLFKNFVDIGDKTLMVRNNNRRVGYG